MARIAASHTRSCAREPIGVGADDAVEDPLGPVDGADRFRVPAPSFGDERLLQQHAARRGRVAREELSRCGIGGTGLGVHPTAVLHVTQRLQDDRALVVGGVAAIARRFQRPAVQLRGFHVRVDIARGIGRDAGVTPRLLVTLRVEEVQGEQRGVALLVVGIGEHRVGDLAVETLARPVRKARVRDIAHEGVAESHPPGRVGREEFGQSRERLFDRHVVGIDGTEVVAVEARTEYRDAPQPRPVLGGQAIDARRDQTLDRAGHRGDVAAFAEGTEQLEEEQRVAVGPIDQLVGHVLRQRRGRRRRGHEQRRRGPAEWLEDDPLATLRRVEHETGRHPPPREAHEPRLVRSRARRARERDLPRSRPSSVCPRSRGWSVR